MGFSSFAEWEHSEQFRQVTGRVAGLGQICLARLFLECQERPFAGLA